MKHAWRVWLTEAAQCDFFRVLSWTNEQFGKREARVYEKTLRSALKALAFGPRGIGCRARPDLGSDVASLHVARQGRKGRHLLIFRADEQNGVIAVLRILHDSMDLARHLHS